MFLVFAPSVGVEYFWVDLYERYVVAYSSVEAAYLGRVYVILILRARQVFKGQQSLTIVNVKLALNI